MEEKVVSSRSRVSVIGMLFLLIGMLGIALLVFVVEPSAIGYIIVIAFGFIGVVLSTFAIMLSDRRKKKADEQ